MGRLEELEELLQSKISEALDLASGIHGAYLVEPVLIVYGDLGPLDDEEILVFLEPGIDTPEKVIEIYLRCKYGMTDSDLEKIDRVEAEVWARYKS